MKFGVYALFAAVAYFYIWTVRTIWQLVDESKRTGTVVRFNRWKWTPAWKVHRTAYLRADCGDKSSSAFF
jgi:hypothetical protein